MTSEATTGTVEVPGGYLAYTSHGHGPPVVLLHGGMLDHRLWDPQIEPLAREHQVVAVDARGHGWSSTPLAPFRHCDDLAVLLEGLELAPATLVGLSMGAAIATDTAIAYPHLVARLVVSGAGISNPQFRDPALLEVLQLWADAGARRDRDGFLDAFMRLNHGPDRSPADVAPGVNDVVYAMASHTLEVHVGDEPPIMGSFLPEAHERAHEITVPVLAVNGADDYADHLRLPRELVDLAGGHYLEITGAHYPNLEDPDRFTTAVLDHLDATDP